MSLLDIIHFACVAISHRKNRDVKQFEARLKL